MTDNAFKTKALTKAMNNVKHADTSFLDWLYPEVLLHNSEYIDTDINIDRPIIAPLVSEFHKGKPVGGKKQKSTSILSSLSRVTDHVSRKDLLVRQAGQKATDSNEGKAVIAVQESIRRSHVSITDRITLMAVDALVKGKLEYTTDEDGQEEYHVDFQRDDSLTVNIGTTADKWTNKDLNIVKQLTGHARKVKNLSGASVNTVLLSYDAWDLMSEMTAVKELIRTDSGSASALELACQAGDSLKYKGKLGDYHIVVFEGTYNELDENRNIVTKYFMPSNTAVLLNDKAITGVRHFGAIDTEDKGLQKLQYHVEEEWTKGARNRTLYTESRPVTVPHLINASCAITVA